MLRRAVQYDFTAILVHAEIAKVVCVFIIIMKMYVYVFVCGNEGKEHFYEWTYYVFIVYFNIHIYSNIFLSVNNIFSVNILNSGIYC